MICQADPASVVDTENLYFMMDDINKDVIIEETTEDDANFAMENLAIPRILIYSVLEQ